MTGPAADRARSAATIHDPAAGSAPGRLQLGRRVRRARGGFALFALGGLELAACLLGSLGRAASLLGRAKAAGHRPFEPIPGTRSLLVGPELAKPIEQEIAAGPQVDDQDLEAAVRGAVRRSCGKSWVEVGRLAGSLAHRRGVGLPQLGEMAFDPG